MPLINEVIQAYRGDTPEDEVIKEYFEVLAELAEVQNKLNCNIIENNVRIFNKEYDNLSIPIQRALDIYNQTHVLKKLDISNLSAKVHKYVEEFINPSEKDIIRGVTERIVECLNQPMNEIRNEERNSYQSIVFIENGALLRVTFIIYLRKPHAKILKGHYESVISVVAYKMLVDLERLDFREFQTLYEKVLAYSIGDNSEKIAKRIKEAEERYQSAPIWRPRY